MTTPFSPRELARRLHPSHWPKVWRLALPGRVPAGPEAQKPGAPAPGPGSEGQPSPGLGSPGLWSLGRWSVGSWSLGPWSAGRWSRLPVPLGRLAVPLIAAALLHGLLLAFTELRRQRQPAPPALAARDDTPELLRFSRESARTTGLSGVPLPPLSVLPPPPPAPLGLPGAGRIQPLSPGSGVTGVRGRQRGGVGREGAATGSAAPAPRRTSDLPPPGGEGAGTPLGWLRAAQRLAATPVDAAPPPPAAPGSPAPAGPTADAPTLLRPEAAAAQPYRKVWTAARPPEEPPEGLTDLPEAVQLRRLTLQEAQGLGLQPPGTRQAVLLEGQVLLLWTDGSTLWLLRGPAEVG